MMRTGKKLSGNIIYFFSVYIHLSIYIYGYIHIYKCIYIYAHLCKHFRADCNLLAQKDDHLAGISIRNNILCKIGTADTPKLARRREENTAWLKECGNNYLIS